MFKENRIVVRKKHAKAREEKNICNVFPEIAFLKTPPDRHKGQNAACHKQNGSTGGHFVDEVASDIFSNFREVSTTKHSPSKLEDALRIWGDLWFFLFSSIKILFKLPRSRARNPFFVTNEFFSRGGARMLLCNSYQPPPPPPPPPPPLLPPQKNCPRHCSKKVVYWRKI